MIQKYGYLKDYKYNGEEQVMKDEALEAAFRLLDGKLKRWAERRTVTIAIP